MSFVHHRQMYYYKCLFQYDGTDYSGFQDQKDAPSIQQEINRAIHSIYSEHFSTKGFFRTDSGVHALKQIVKLSSVSSLDCHHFLTVLNSKLPSQIKCQSIVPIAQIDLFPTKETAKEYRYFFTNQKIVANEDQRFIANFSPALNLELMKVCTSHIIGKHDFKHFSSKGSNVSSTIRTISECDLSIVNPHDVFANLPFFQIPKSTNTCFQFRIVGNGFLKQMVRHLISALWMGGSGKLSIDDFYLLIEDKVELKQRWRVAPPNGLFLFDVNENGSLFN